MPRQNFSENQQIADDQVDGAYTHVCFLIQQAKAIADQNGLVFYAGTYSPKLSKGYSTVETGKGVLRKVLGGIAESDAFRKGLIQIGSAALNVIQNPPKK